MTDKNIENFLDNCINGKDEEMKLDFSKYIKAKMTNLLRALKPVNNGDNDANSPNE